MICFHISDRFVHTNQTIRNVGISDRLFLVENIIFVPISVRTSQFLSWKIEKDSSSWFHYALKMIRINVDKVPCRLWCVEQRVGKHHFTFSFVTSPLRVLCYGGYTSTRLQLHHPHYFIFLGFQLLFRGLPFHFLKDTGYMVYILWSQNCVFICTNFFYLCRRVGGWGNTYVWIVLPGSFTLSINDKQKCLKLVGLWMVLCQVWSSDRRSYVGDPHKLSVGSSVRSSKGLQRIKQKGQTPW